VLKVPVPKNASVPKNALSLKTPLKEKRLFPPWQRKFHFDE
jgi:hypothetical protein